MARRRGVRVEVGSRQTHEVAPSAQVRTVSQPNERGLDRRSLLVRGGAVAAGAVGATLAGAAAATPAYAAGFGYTPITPYRSFDSRNGDPALKINSREYFGLQLITDEFGGPTEVPVNAQALTFNLTITQTEGVGYLGVVPGGTQPVGFVVSNINWVASGLDLANGGTTKLAFDPDPGAGPGSVVVYCDGTGRTHFLIDVTGYYA